jgi:uncharacterized protein
MEKVITFLNREKTRLFGILHEPETSRKDLGILFVHSGVQGRHGNINQYVYYAREMCKQGYPCFRFDPTGLGDSEGWIPQMDMRDFYGSIQTGRYVNDTLDAVAEFRKNGVENIVFFGLCGGAITALLTAPFAQEVSGLILLSVPTILDSSNVNSSLRIPKEIAASQLQNYLKKLLHWRYWIRLISFKSDFSTIWNYLRAFFQTSKPEKDGANDGRAEFRPAKNKLFDEAYNACKNKKDILWVFGNNDGFWYDFKREVIEKNLFNRSEELNLLDKANHMFTLLEWQADISSIVLRWLGKNLKPLCK